MEFFKSLILVVLLCFVIFQLRILPFREKRTRAPEKTAPAKLTARRIESGTGNSGRSSGMGYSYILTFHTNTAEVLDLYAYETKYGALREGQNGILTWKGPYFISFQEVDA